MTNVINRLGIGKEGENGRDQLYGKCGRRGSGDVHIGRKNIYVIWKKCIGSNTHFM